MSLDHHLISNDEAKRLEQSPAALAGEYLRSFTTSLGHLGEFSAFLDEVKRVVTEDPYLRGAVELSGASDTGRAIPDFESLDPEETIVSVASESGHSGYLKYSGRRDGTAFGTEDLHLMGAIAGFISVLTGQAEKFHQNSEASKVLSYLIDQLPLGVVCFGADAAPLVDNKVARRLLGESGHQLLASTLDTVVLPKDGRLRLHFEVEGRFLYVEGRRLAIDAATEVSAFVLYDISNQRERLLLDLDREAYRCEARGESFTLAVFQDRSEAGAVYRRIKSMASDLKLDPSKVQVVDAYACACTFKAMSVRSVRFLLESNLKEHLSDGVHLGLINSRGLGHSDSPSTALLEQAFSDMLPVASALRPTLLVLDPYPAVAESLELIVNESCSVASVESQESAIAAIESGQFDALFLDWDSYEALGSDWLAAAIDRAGTGFKVFYCSHRQPGMVLQNSNLSPDAIVLQKPFDAEALSDRLALQFNFA